MNILILLFMVAMHILEDFHLQGIMAQMKQKSWWREQTTDERYDRDYWAVLALHGFEWAVFVNLPIMAWMVIQGGWGLLDANSMWLAPEIIIMAAIHACIDDLKANYMRINLVQDQIAHLIQIGVIYLFWCCSL